MSLADAVVGVAAIIAAIRGWRLGLTRQLFEMGGGFLGLVAGITIGPRVAEWFTDKPDMKALVIALVVVFVFLTAGQALGVLLGHKTSTLASRGRIAPLDKGAGIAFGMVVTLLAYWIVGSLLVNGPSRPIARSLKHSYLLRTLNKISTPPDIVSGLRQYLNTSGFPQVFVGMPRSLGPPVELPPNSVAGKAVRAARASTVRIIVDACDATSLGSGWISADGTVVTNAHVVAGGTDVDVEDANGVHDATVVLFEPGVDLAILKTSDLAGEPLDLATEDLERGEGGAVLGYPGNAGGQFVPVRAAVSARFDALGRDIYGKKKVHRDVYELRAVVRHGNSGGPFVLPDGRVGGVVFAASTTDKDTGYALTPQEVADEITEGATLSEEVSTGECTA